METKINGEKSHNQDSFAKANIETATLGAGCFWCVEAVFQSLEGVISVTSGYTGGHVKNPTYHDVCSGHTGHAEVAKIEFDPRAISFEDILEVFWQTHNPTTLNKQGNDEGTQYRSAIFFHDKKQKEIAEKSKSQAEGIFDDPIVTEITPLSDYYDAEDYHQNYFTNNPNQPYCSLVIRPKIDKFKKQFNDKLKKN